MDLTPLMNLIAILIPCLLISVAFVEVAGVEAHLPAGDDRVSHGPDLAVSVTVTTRGYLLAVANRDLAQATGSPEPELIPLVERSVPCSRYRQVAPPPRDLNAGTGCRTYEELETQVFVVYDRQSLTDRLHALKGLHPAARSITLNAEPEVEFEAIIDVMDASRDMPAPSGEVVDLFPEVFIHPATP